MNNKGFTLIELTAIVVVLAAIFLVSFPNLLNLAKSKEDDKHEVIVNDLCLAGKSYIYANTDEFSELLISGNKINILIQDLINSGNVDNNLMDPVTNKSVKSGVLNYTVLSDLSLDCEYDSKATLAQYITSLYRPNATSLSVDGITYKLDTTHGLMDDRLGGTVSSGGNIRYYGATPNNYIDIGDRDSSGNVILWRIIGLFKDVQVTDANGNVTGTEDLVKIIRNDSIGKFSWDCTSSRSYDNNWSDSTLNTMLNGAYYNSSTTSYYNNSTTATSVDFKSNGSGLSPYAQIKVESVVWNLGGSSTHSGVYVNDWYSYERGDFRYNTTRPLTWPGKIALMYPSDYGYATDLTQCNQDLDSSFNTTECKGTDWLYKTSKYQWTLTPQYTSEINVFNVHSNGYMATNPTNYYSNRELNPVLYLKSDVNIIGGSGLVNDTTNDPYVID